MTPFQSPESTEPELKYHVCSYDKGEVTNIFSNLDAYTKNSVKAVLEYLFILHAQEDDKNFIEYIERQLAK